MTSDAEIVERTPNGVINSDDAKAAVVMQAMLECANAWEGDARLIGNVRAKDMRRAICELDDFITRLSARVEELETKNRENFQAREYLRGEFLRVQTDLERLQRGLMSIADNTCCGHCQEAALVARSLLTPSKNKE